jgi:hypothetical protein
MSRRLKLLAALALAAWLAAGPSPAAAADPPGTRVAAPTLALAREVERTVAEAAPRLENLTGAGLRRVTVRVAGSESAYRQWMEERDAPRWSAGVAVPAENLILLRSPGQLAAPGEFPFVLVHELTHLYLHQALRGRRPPLWLEEGIAMYAAGQGGLGLASAMTRAVLSQGLAPLESLSRRFPAESGRAGLAYAQSYYLISYLLNTYGRDAPARLVGHLAQGREMTTALKLVTGKGLAQVEKEFREAMTSRFSWLALLFAGGTLWAGAAALAGVGLVWRWRRQRRRLRALDQPAEARTAGADGRRNWPPPPVRGDVLGQAGLGPGRRRPERAEGDEGGGS